MAYDHEGYEDACKGAAKVRKAADEAYYEKIMRDQAALAALPAELALIDNLPEAERCDLDRDKLAVDGAFSVANEFILRRRTETGYIEQAITTSNLVQDQADVDPDKCYKCKSSEQIEPFDTIYKDGLYVPVCKDCNRVLCCPVCKETIPSDLKTDKMDAYGNPCCPKCFPPEGGE